MVCSWTVSRQYSEFVRIQGRGDGGILEHMYHPTNKGTKVVGEAVYIKYFDADDHTVTDPSCSAFLAGQSCNEQVALTKYLKVDKQCFDDCKWEEIANDADMQALAQAMIKAQLNTLLPLIYADMIANGTAIHDLSATPTGAQVLAGITQGMMAINANGGDPGAIVLDLTHSGAVVAAMGALFQPANAVKVNFKYGPGMPVGDYLGYAVFVTPDDLATTDATPIKVSALVWAENGFGYAYNGDNMGCNITTHPQGPNGTNDVLARMCVGYKTILATLVYYVTDQT